MKKCVLTYLILFGLFATSAFAQNKLSVNRTSGLIGDQILLTLEVANLPGREWVNQNVIPADTVAEIQMLQTSEIQNSAAKNAILKQWTIAVYDTGIIRIPRVPIIRKSASGFDTSYTLDIPLQIHGVADSTGMAPIKSIVYEPVNFSDYLPYIIALVVIILLVLFAIWWKRRPKKEEEIIEEEKKAAHEIALEELILLKSEELWQAGKVKEYHMKLSHILRAYLEERYAVAALESTTSEVRKFLKPLLSPMHFDDMMRMMEIEDLIKFAKAQPPMEVHDQHFDFVREFVLNTQQIIEKEESDD